MALREHHGAKVIQKGWIRYQRRRKEHENEEV